MLGGIISILCAVWFYRTAVAKAAPGIQWAVVGFVTFFLPNLVWKLWVAQPIAVKFHAQNAFLKAGLISNSGVLVGAVVAWLVWSKVLNKLKSS